jgi:hypothetical protein
MCVSLTPCRPMCMTPHLSCAMHRLSWTACTGVHKGRAHGMAWGQAHTPGPPPCCCSTANPAPVHARMGVSFGSQQGTEMQAHHTTPPPCLPHTHKQSTNRRGCRADCQVGDGTTPLLSPPYPANRVWRWCLLRSVGRSVRRGRWGFALNVDKRVERICRAITKQVQRSDARIEVDVRHTWNECTE